MSLVAEKASNQTKVDPIRVMLVDDSAVIRGLIARILEADPEIVIAATAANGAQAVKGLERSGAEVVVLDIEMPVMDGLTALPQLLECDARLKIIVASTLSQRNAQISLKALEAGATDYIPKPTSTGEINTGIDFRRELLEKVKALGAAYRNETVSAEARSEDGGARAARTAGVKAKEVARRPLGSPAIKRYTLRKQLPKHAEIIAIGSSTGGPQALLALLKDLSAAVKVPILITQHMPATFTTILAEHITKASGRPCTEAVDGGAIEAGRIYIAPGNWHMVVEEEGGRKVTRLNQDPPVNFCRPAVDPMLKSAAEAYEGRVLAVILTGMGQDGLVGGESVIEQGGTVVAQDEATSVVW
ncbi:MAG: chemotaxis-specific protein-glutamate methyltransferase CheB, partial [Acidiferrobacterales bacterium]|nr:chemotaxis-specific protein-glutamate methyltransferase CheB [Acidiferrobacterales bacterium]